MRIADILALFALPCPDGGTIPLPQSANRMAAVVYYRFVAEPPLTLSATAERIPYAGLDLSYGHVTRERVRQLETKGVRHLRRGRRYTSAPPETWTSCPRLYHAITGKDWTP